MLNQQLKKSLITIFILALSGLCAYTIPHHRYEGTGILKEINLPSSVGQWTAYPVADHVINLNTKYTAYIKDFKTVKYVHPNGSVIYLSILDAGNFHNPKICFIGSGFETFELVDTKLSVNNLSVSTTFFKKQDQQILLLYWMTINQKRVNWIEQKTADLWYALLNKKRVGLIVRLDIPTEEKDIKMIVVLAQDLIGQLEQILKPNERAYLFGR